MPSYIMAVDQGTTSTRVCIFDHAGALIGQSSQAYPQIYPKPGWVEHNPEEIWGSTTKTMEQALTQSKISPSHIAGIGITNQRETVILWDAHTHQTLYNAIVWQCRRTQDFCLQLKKQKKEKWIYKKTGLVVDPYFSGSKIRWLLNNVPNARKKDVRVGTIDSFLLWRLTSGESHCTDVSNASRTMLMDIKKLSWDPELLKLFSVPEKILPQIKPSSGIFGFTKGLGFLPDGIPISGIAGDQQAALFGQVGFGVGDVKCTFGTGSFILLNTGNKLVASKNKLLTTVAWQLPKQNATYALEGGAFICGAAVQWLRDGLGLFSKSSEIEQLAMRVQDTEGVEFVPALTGLGAPYWRAEARGVITGLTRGTTKSHIARATLEAMALQNAEILQVMEKDLGRKLKSIKVDGGAAGNNLLMQMQADYGGAKVIRPEITETTAVGAAYLAGLGVGFWKDLSEIRKIWKTNKDFSVKMSSKARKVRLLHWQKAVSKT